LLHWREREREREVEREREREREREIERVDLLLMKMILFDCLGEEEGRRRREPVE
jgi:hypothetical protein